MILTETFPQGTGNLKPESHTMDNRKNGYLGNWLT